MINITKRNITIYLLITFVIITISFLYLFIEKREKDKILVSSPILINLLTNVHPSLPWNFIALKSNISVIPGEVITVEYIVENLSEQETTGVATFAYIPNQFGKYIRKINCFCYDAQTLKSKKKDKFTLILLIDPAVTKDSKTKSIKEVTIQFTFFNYKNYKESKS